MGAIDWRRGSAGYDPALRPLVEIREEGKGLEGRSGEVHPLVQGPQAVHASVRRRLGDQPRSAVLSRKTAALPPFFDLPGGHCLIGPREGLSLLVLLAQVPQRSVDEIM